MSILEGLRVLDPTQGRAGPYCTLLLAAFGAQVLKIEPPGLGDAARREGPFLHDEPHPERSAPFLYLNRNKWSVTLDFHTELGKGLFLKLVKLSDVVVESFEPGVMESLGLGPVDLKQQNPSLVLTSITDFGQTGPYRDFKGAEIVLDALAGWSSLTGYPDREPLRPGLYQAQYAAGLNGALHAVAALNVRAITGEDRTIDVSALETAVHWMGGSISMFSHGDGDRMRAGNWTGMAQGATGPRSHPTEIYECLDGYVGVAVQSPQQWEMFTLLLDVPALREDPRFATDYATRGRHALELNEAVTPWFKARTRKEIFRLCGEYRIPAGMVYNVEEILQDPQNQAAQYFEEVEHPEVGKLPYAKSPIRNEHISWAMQRAPLLGEHNREVFCNLLGCSQQEYLELYAMGVI